MNENFGKTSLYRDVVGNDLIYNDSKLKLVAKVADWEMASYLVVYCKAIRRVSGYLGIRVGESDVIALSMVKACNKHVKGSGGAMSRIITWSGYTRNWQALMKGSIERCLANGLLEKFPRNGGMSLRLSQKGQSVLDTLDLMGKNVLDEILGLREKPKSRHNENRIRSSKS